MRKTEIAEASDYLRQVLQSLLASPVNAPTLAGAELFRQVGALSASAETAIQGATLGLALLGCFDAAYAAGATLTTIGQVRTQVVAPVLTGQPAIHVQQACLRMALVEESKILANTPLVSRQDVDAYLARMNDAFEPAELFAADAHDADSYTAIVTLHAAVSRDLTTRGRPLPRLVSYFFPNRMPALVLAQRLYSDPSRYDELIAENVPFNPAFFPAAGTALSA